MSTRYDVLEDTHISPTYVYEVNFRIRNKDAFCIAKSIHDVTQGFWVRMKQKNGVINHVITKGSDCELWIPPSALLYIRKIPV